VCPRITKNVERPTPVTIRVNGDAVSAYEGESLATALIASGTLIMSQDAKGRMRSPYCNMGICFDCLVTVEESTASGGSTVRRVRACLALVRPGLLVTVPAR
jgi:D-hydroxyproline dehydrogenase subunit gamma